ncbi:hypothetical protein FRC02_007558 [Tulasnella sp. 418]|nr:hypothetical protein FRC02_007558 [Tulasnella sp. 418]
MAEQAPATSSSSPLTDDQYDEACDLVGEGVNLVAQFRENKDASLLEKAIANFRDSLRIWTKGHPDRPIPLTNLSNGLWHRFEVEGKMEDLEEALAYAEEAFPLHHPGELGYYATLQLLRSTMGARFEYTNNMEDLKKTLDYPRRHFKLSLGQLQAQR